MKKEKVKPNYSIWLIFDSIVCGGVFLISPAFTILCAYYMYFILFSLVGLSFILGAKRLYDKNILRTDKFRKVTTVTRSVIYSIVIISFAIPFLAGGTHNKSGYPIRRAIFLSHYQKNSIWHRVLPKHIPDKADNYSISLMIGFGPATSGADISFYTDSSVISEYKRIAQEYDTEYYAYSPEDEEMYENGEYIDKDKEKFLFIIAKMRNSDMSDNDIQNSEIYDFSHGNNRFVWILNEKTGYFRAYA